MSQENINQENDLNNEFSSSESYLATFEAAIYQLQRIIENPQSGQKTTITQNQQQLQILSEKYEKIEKLVYCEQEQIEQLITTHVELQKELNEEYSKHQGIISQGKKEILQLTLANKHALQIQNDGQRTLNQNQQEVERIVQYIQKLQKDITSLNVIMQDKQKEENTIDDETIKLQNSIDEFRRDQSDQKDGLEDKKLQIIQHEKQIKQVRKEQFDMQKKSGAIKKTVQEIKQKTNQFLNDNEVALSELRNEKRTLAVSEKKLEEINAGLQQISNEIALSDQSLEQIRDLNKNMKGRVSQVENAIMIYQSEGVDSEELKTLEGLLGEYTQLLSEKQKVYQSKEQEKVLLSDHLQQMSKFAQEYLEKQNQLHQQNSENQLSNFTTKLEAASDSLNHGVGTGQNNNNIHNINNSQTFGMECIQSQYEQEQESSAHTHSLNVMTQHQSKKEKEKQSSNQIPQERQDIEEQLLQAQNLEQQQQQQEQVQQQPISSKREALQSVEVQQQNESFTQQNHESIVQNNSVQQETTHFETIITNHQNEFNPDQLHDQEVHLDEISENHGDDKVINQSFGNEISPSMQESPVQAQRYQNNFNLDSEQQQIQSEFASGQFSVDQQKLQEFIDHQENLEQQEQQNNTQNNDTQSKKNSSQHALSETNQKMIIRMGIPGIGGYKDILSQFHNLQNKAEQE